MPALIEVAPAALFVENLFFRLATAAFLVATTGYILNLAGKKEWGSFASQALRIAFVLQTAFLAIRGINVERVPFVGHYEFGNLFIWGTVLVYLWTEWRQKDRYYAVGAFLLPLVLLYVIYVNLPLVNPVHRPLPLVLRYPLWLNIHVSTSVLGYAGFSLAFALALMWLLRAALEHKKNAGQVPLIFRAVFQVLPQPRALEDYMYSASSFGFLFQTAMIVSGSIWADASWGRYWGWDPKEMWSLITWFVFAVYLHARFTQGWTGFRTVALVAVGWMTMMFTWLGVAWLLPGIHSFG
ncbi:MAG: Cytochrome c biogenesis protein CcsA [Syntrophomonadaceae bacterium]|nr:Cytochrome c biogenesis protein CcsA [Bacillota bacterium]